jgi:hypothetical protein
MPVNCITILKEEYGDLEDGLYAKLKQTKEIS